MSVPALQRKLSEIVVEYDEKLAAIEKAAQDFEDAGTRLKKSCTISGVWGNISIDTGHIYTTNLERSLLSSAWRHVYNGLNIESIAPVSDKKKFERAIENPAPFTLDNIRATFGDYILNPLDNILRGLAEAFCDLDPAYKSHSKVKIGVEGLPKRVVLPQMNSFYGYGRDRLRDTLNALAAYQGKPLVEHHELDAVFKDNEALLKTRGVILKRFKNGNGHLHFTADTCRDINKALAEYYGDVLPDCYEEKPNKRRESTAVSKDLQYYPTPNDVVERVVHDMYVKGEKILEPSCGCGRFMDALKKLGADVTGIEVDRARAEQCRAKGHKVLVGNFLDITPASLPEYDRVVMNPPFYGTHYAKHVHHALKFLKVDGVLTAVLPVTARYDHGLLNDLGNWYDLPVGSFKASGTNVNTSILTVRKRLGNK